MSKAISNAPRADQEVHCFAKLVHKQAARITAPLVPPRLAIDDSLRAEVNRTWNVVCNESPVRVTGQHVAQQVVDKYARALAGHCFERAGQMRKPLKNELRPHNQLGGRVTEFPALTANMCTSLMLVRPFIEHCFSVGHERNSSLLARQLQQHMVTVSHCRHYADAVRLCLREQWPAVMAIAGGAYFNDLGKALQSLRTLVQQRLDWDVIVFAATGTNGKRVYTLTRAPERFIVNAKAGGAFLKLGGDWKQTCSQMRVLQVRD